MCSILALFTHLHPSTVHSNRAGHCFPGEWANQKSPVGKLFINISGSEDFDRRRVRRPRSPFVPLLSLWPIHSENLGESAEQSESEAPFVLPLQSTLFSAPIPTTDFRVLAVLALVQGWAKIPSLVEPQISSVASLLCPPSKLKTRLHSAKLSMGTGTASERAGGILQRCCVMKCQINVSASPPSLLHKRGEERNVNLLRLCELSHRRTKGVQHTFRFSTAWNMKLDLC